MPRSSLVVTTFALCLATATSGCLFFSHSGGDAGAVVDAGTIDAGSTDAGDDDGGTIEFDGGAIDAGGADAGDDDGGTFDAGFNDGGLTDAGSVDAGDDDGGEVDAGEVDAGEVDAGEVPRFHDDPFQDQPHRVRVRFLAMNNPATEDAFPLVVRVPPALVAQSGVTVENVRAVEVDAGTFNVLPLQIEYASETEGILLYTKVSQVVAAGTDQGIFIYFGPEATTIGVSSNAVFDPALFHAVFPFPAGESTRNLVNGSPVGLDGAFGQGQTITGSGHNGGTLDVTNLVATDVEDSAMVSIALDWPNTAVGNGVTAVQGGANNLMTLGRSDSNGRIRLEVNDPTTPLSSSRQMFRTRFAYAAVEGVTNPGNVVVRLYGPELDSVARAVPGDIALAELFSPLRFGNIEWPTAIDEVRIGKGIFSPSYHYLTSLNATGHLVEVLTEPRPIARPPRLSGAVNGFPPDHHWTFENCLTNECPDSGALGALNLVVDSNAIDTDRGAFVYRGGVAASADPPECPGSFGITVAAWFTPDNLRAYGPGRIVTLSSDTSAQAFVLGQTMTGPDDVASFIIRDQQLTAGAPQFAHSASVDVGVPQFVAASITFGGDVILCIDANCETAYFQSSMESASDVTATRLRIGNESGGRRAAAGIYDEVSFWCEPLTPTQLNTYFDERQE